MITKIRKVLSLPFMVIGISVFMCACPFILLGLAIRYGIPYTCNVVKRAI